MGRGVGMGMGCVRRAGEGRGRKVRRVRRIRRVSVGVRVGKMR